MAPDLSKYLELFLSEGKERIQEMQKTLLLLEKEAEPSAVDRFLRDAHSLKGMSAAMGFTAMRDLSHAVEELIHAVRDKRLDLTAEHHDLLHEAATELSKMMDTVDAEGAIGEWDAERIVTSLHAEAAKAKPEREPESVPLVSIPDLPQTRPDPEPAQPGATTQPAADRTVKVTTGLLDRLIDGLGEILVVRHLVAEEAHTGGNPALLEAVMRLDRAVTDLRGDVVASRLAPLNTILDRLPLVARNVSRARGKDVDTRLTGSEIEIDRSILEALDQPLMHIIRNAVDHGLEPRRDRVKAGKSARGKLEITARLERDLVVITIHDDGRGMDPQAIRDHAVEGGLLSREAADELDDDAALSLVFRAGLSTRAEVTDISGRGVGMDVVKTVVERFGGDVALESVKGSGTTIMLKLPRLVALMHVVLVQSAGETVAVPMSKVERTIEITTDELRDLQVTMPVRHLGEVLRLERPNGSSRNGRFRALIVDGPRGRVAYEVDAITGLREVVVKPLSEPLQRIEGLSGITLVEDGRAIFVLDPQKFE